MTSIATRGHGLTLIAGKESERACILAKWMDHEVDAKRPILNLFPIIHRLRNSAEEQELFLHLTSSIHEMLVFICLNDSSEATIFIQSRQFQINMLPTTVY